MMARSLALLLPLLLAGAALAAPVVVDETVTSTGTGTPSGSVTGTGSSSQTSSGSPSPSETPTPSDTARATRTPTRTLTAASSTTPTPAVTTSSSPSQSGTPTSSLSEKAVPSVTPSNTPSPSVTPTSSAASTTTRTPESSFTSLNTRTTTRTSDATFSSTATQTPSPSQSISKGVEPSSTGTSLPTPSVAPSFFPIPALGVGLQLPQCTAELLAENLGLCVALRCTLACLVGTPINQVYINFTTSCFGQIQDFVETDPCNKLQTCPCSPARGTGGRRLSDDSGSVGRSGWDYEWVATMPELGPGKTIWFTDAAASLEKLAAVEAASTSSRGDNTSTPLHLPLMPETGDWEEARLQWRGRALQVPEIVSSASLYIKGEPTDLAVAAIVADTSLDQLNEDTPPPLVLAASASGFTEELFSILNNVSLPETRDALGLEFVAPELLPSFTATRTSSASVTGTPSSSVTQTPSSSVTQTSSSSETGTPSSSETGTPSSSVTRTPSSSATQTPSSSVTQTPSSSLTQTPSSSLTQTPSTSVTQTPSSSATGTASSSTTASPSATATWSGYASPGKPCDDDFIVDLVVVEVNVTTRVVTSRKICNIDGTFANSSSVVPVDPLQQMISRGFGFAEEPRTPFPYTLKVPKRHVHKVGRLSREGRGAHARLKSKSQNL